MYIEFLEVGLNTKQITHWHWTKDEATGQIVEYTVYLLGGQKLSFEKDDLITFRAMIATLRSFGDGD